jgi:hypothetical protein
MKYGISKIGRTNSERVEFKIFNSFRVGEICLFTVGFTNGYIYLILSELFLRVIYVKQNF